MTALSANLQAAERHAPYRRHREGGDPSVLAEIYQADINIAVWQRELAPELLDATRQILVESPRLQEAIAVTPKNANAAIYSALGGTPAAARLGQDVAQLVDMFCCLFDLKRAGLRLTGLDKAMCPRFHVDRVPCRLVTTYQGIATQWLPHDRVDRSKLGTGNQGKPDEQSGLFAVADDIQQMRQGDVALLKGELWDGNEGAGLVHRSPHPGKDGPRLLFTLDFINE